MIALVGDDGFRPVVWGLGATMEEARADAWAVGEDAVPVLDLDSLDEYEISETPQHTHCPVCDRPIYNGKHPDLPCVPGRQIGDVWIPAKPDVRVLSVHGNDKVTGRDYRAAY